MRKSCILYIRTLSFSFSDQPMRPTRPASLTLNFFDLLPGFQGKFNPTLATNHLRHAPRGRFSLLIIYIYLQLWNYYRKIPLYYTILYYTILLLLLLLLKTNVEEPFAYRWGSVDMTSLEILGIYALLLFNLGWTLILLSKATNQIVFSLSQLDSALGESLVDVIQDLGNVDIQQQDPIRMAVASWIANNISGNASSPEEKLSKLARDASGKFS